jgi:hypothetical protein
LGQSQRQGPGLAWGLGGPSWGPASLPPPPLNTRRHLSSSPYLQALGLTNFCDDSDSLVLEDEGARLVLRPAAEGALPVGALLTGARAGGRRRQRRQGQQGRRRRTAGAGGSTQPPFHPTLLTSQPRRAPPGVVAAVRGRAEAGGDFIVTDVCYAGLPPQPPRPVFERDTYVALVSGLELASGAADRLRVRGRGA